MQPLVAFLDRSQSMCIVRRVTRSDSQSFIRTRLTELRDTIPLLEKKDISVENGGTKVELQSSLVERLHCTIERNLLGWNHLTIVVPRQVFVPHADEDLLNFNAFLRFSKTSAHKKRLDI